MGFFDSSSIWIWARLIWDIGTSFNLDWVWDRSLGFTISSASTSIGQIVLQTLGYCSNNKLLSIGWAQFLEIITFVLILGFLKQNQGTFGVHNFFRKYNNVANCFHALGNGSNCELLGFFQQVGHNFLLKLSHLDRFCGILEVGVNNFFSEYFNGPDCSSHTRLWFYL